MRGSDEAGSTRRHAGRAVRYLLVGGSGYLVNVAAFASVLWLASTTPALVAAYASNTAWNFVLNRRFTFEATDRGWHLDLPRFLAVAVLVLAVNYTAFEVLYHVAGLPPVAAQALSVFVGLPVGFLANLVWTFAPGRAPIDRPISPGSSDRP